jgi:hypothetical protein
LISDYVITIHEKMENLYNYFSIGRESISHRDHVLV